MGDVFGRPVDDDYHIISSRDLSQLVLRLTKVYPAEERQVVADRCVAIRADCANKVPPMIIIEVKCYSNATFVTALATLHRASFFEPVAQTPESAKQVLGYCIAVCRMTDAMMTRLLKLKSWNVGQGRLLLALETMCLRLRNWLNDNGEWLNSGFAKLSAKVAVQRSLKSAWKTVRNTAGRLLNPHADGKLELNDFLIMWEKYLVGRNDPIRNFQQVTNKLNDLAARCNASAEIHYDGVLASIEEIEDNSRNFWEPGMYAAWCLEKMTFDKVLEGFVEYFVPAGISDLSVTIGNEVPADEATAWVAQIHQLDDPDYSVEFLEVCFKPDKFPRAELTKKMLKKYRTKEINGAESDNFILRLQAHEKMHLPMELND